MSKKKKITLRDYQKECIDTIEKAGSGSHVVAIATGLGKTVIFTNIKRHGRTLILSHRDELVRQPEKYYDCSYGVEKADEHSDGEDVVSASVQTLCGDARLHQFKPDEFDTIIVDECHHAASPSYKKILNYFDGAERILGFTATPKRGDHVKLNDVFDDIIFSRDLRWGIEHNYLSRIRSIRVTANFDLGKVAKVAGDYSPDALEQVMVEGEAIPVAAKSYIELCHNQGRHTIIYCVSRRVCQLLLTTIRESLPKNERKLVQMITGETPAEERSKYLKDFSSGKLKALINCMVLTEGTDLPIADCIMNMRPTCNDSLYQQIVGRGTRLCDGKDYCLVIDILPKKDQERELCSAPTLFGVDPKVLDKESKKKVSEGKADLLDICSVISDSMAEVAQDINLRIENVNLFLDECNDMIDESKNILGLAQNYTKQQNDRSASDEWDFLGMDVTIQPDENKRYRIKPNWSDEIYLSAPDVLGNTRIEVDITDGARYGFPGSRVFTSQMEMDKAISFAQKICSIQDDHFKFSWDQDTQKFWLEKNATQAQKERIIRDYAGTVDTMGTSCLDKLSASRVIQLKMEMDQKQSLKNLLETASKPRKSKAKEKAQQELQQMDQRYVEEHAQGEKNFQAFYDKVMKISEHTDKMVLGKKDAQTLTVNLTYDFYPQAGRACSEKQRNFINIMLDNLKAKGVEFDNIGSYMFTARQASVFITILKNIQDRYRGVQGKIVVFDDIGAFLQKIEIGERPQMVSLPFKLSDAPVN